MRAKNSKRLVVSIENGLLRSYIPFSERRGAFVKSSIRIHDPADGFVIMNRRASRNTGVRFAVEMEDFATCLLDCCKVGIISL